MRKKPSVAYDAIGLRNTFKPFCCHHWLVNCSLFMWITSRCTMHIPMTVMLFSPCYKPKQSTPIEFTCIWSWWGPLELFCSSWLAVCRTQRHSDSFDLLSFRVILAWERKHSYCDSHLTAWSFKHDCKGKNTIRIPNFGGIVPLVQHLPPVTKIRLKVTHFYRQTVPFYNSWVNSDLVVELKHQSRLTSDDAQEKELHRHKKLFSGFLHHLTSVDVF